MKQLRKIWRTWTWGTGGVSRRTEKSGGLCWKRPSFSQDCSARIILLLIPMLVIIIIIIIIINATKIQVQINFEIKTPMLEFFTDLIHPAAIRPYGRLSLWQKWVQRISPGGWGRPVRTADNLATLTFLLSRNSGSLNLLEPSGPIQRSTGIALPLSPLCQIRNVRCEIFRNALRRGISVEQRLQFWRRPFMKDIQFTVALGLSYGMRYSIFHHATYSIHTEQKVLTDGMLCKDHMTQTQ